jgi:putative protein kinase ArgK-like GTPase of G3E family
MVYLIYERKEGFGNETPISKESGNPSQYLKGILEVAREIVLNSADLHRGCSITQSIYSVSILEGF